MLKIKLRFSEFLMAFLLVIFCTFFAVGAASSQQVPSGETHAKQQLAREVLLELGIAQRYDLYFDHSMGLVLAPGTNPEFKTWLREMLAQEAGWKYVEDEYVARLEADFSEAELEELLTLSEQPLMKKLLQSEIQAYADTDRERYDLLNAAWINYNEGRINPPPESLL
jgi:Uncharacterized protein conserved in bacteria (DUF2059)